jgi:hypothetical protein
VEAEFDGQRAQELVADHGHLVLRQPVRVLVGETVEEEVDGGHVEEGVA